MGNAEGNEPSDDEPIRLIVDISTIDLEASRTEALRLIAAGIAAADDAGAGAFLHEAARIATGLFDGLDFDTTSEESLQPLAHRITEAIVGLTLAGFHAASIAAAATDLDVLDVLHEIAQTPIDDDD